jgi:4-amino-4-deoxy-L-arabinose transferase-like glycosyltransferase
MINGNRCFFSSNSPQSDQMPPGEILTWCDLFLILGACVPFFLNLGYLQIAGSEGRWLSISQKMLETGGWLEPKLGDAFYGDKPLLSYWTIVLTALPFGRVTEAIARLPSAISGTVTILLTGWLGARFFGRRTAVLAAFVLATAVSFLLWSRTASADAMNVTFITACICTYVSWCDSYRPWKPVVFFLLLFAGGQAKGMPAVIVPLGVVATHILLPFIQSLGRIGRETSIRNELQDILKTRIAILWKQVPWIVLGSVMGVALYLLPFYLSYLERGDWNLLASMYKENFVRVFQAFDHREPIYDYFMVLPVMLLPWSLWIPGAFGWAVKRFPKHEGFRFGLLCFGVIFLLFTASASRRSYYILPIFPFAVILVAAFIEDMLSSSRGLDLRASLWRPFFLIPIRVVGILLIFSAVILLLGPLLPGWPGKLLESLPYATGLGIALGAAAIFFWTSWKQRSERAQVGAVVIAAFLMALYMSTGGEILKQQRLTERSFAVEVREKFPTLGTPVYFGEVNGRLKYYLGRGKEVGNLRELRQIIKVEQEILVITEWEYMQKLESANWLSFSEVLRAEKPASPPFAKSEPTYLLISCKRK